MVIDFEDIREGDRIRVTDPYGNAVEMTAHRRTVPSDEAVWWSEGCIHLIHKGNLDQTIELLERPGPKVERGKAYRVTLKSGKVVDAFAINRQDFHPGGEEELLLVFLRPKSDIVMWLSPDLFDNIVEIP